MRACISESVQTIVCRSYSTLLEFIFRISDAKSQCIPALFLENVSSICRGWYLRPWWENKWRRFLDYTYCNCLEWIRRDIGKLLKSSIKDYDTQRKLRIKLQCHKSIEFRLGFLWIDWRSFPGQDVSNCKKKYRE